MRCRIQKNKQPSAGGAVTIHACPVDADQPHGTDIKIVLDRMAGLTHIKGGAEKLRAGTGQSGVPAGET